MAIGHAAGYELAFEVLDTASGLSVESYAAVTLAEIDSERALGDLLGVLRRADSSAVRRGVAAGLGGIGGSAGKEELVDAVENELVRPTTAARAMSAADATVEELARWLDGAARLARLAIEVLSERAQRTSPPLPAVCCAVRASARRRAASLRAGGAEPGNS